MSEVEHQRRRLIALHRNLPTTERINRLPYVRDYHARLYELRKAGFKVNGFWVPRDQIGRVPDDDQPETVERAFFLARLEALIGCLELPPEPRRIGFRMGD